VYDAKPGGGKAEEWMWAGNQFKINHRGHRGTQRNVKSLCALCVLCGFESNINIF
jgi:hypothetical protein